MTILALDLSLSNTGVAVFDDTGNIISITSIETDKDDNHPKRLKYIVKNLQKIKKTYKPSLVVVEQGFSRFNKSTEALHKVLGVTQFVFWDTEMESIHSTTVRKIVLGRGNAKKPEVQKFILENYKHIEFHNFDESDAFAVGIAYFKRKGIL